MFVVKIHFTRRRFIFYLLGTVTLALGIAMSVRTDIGVAPASTISHALSKLTLLSIGQSTSLYYVLCILIQVIIARKITLKILLQLPVAYLFGLLIDFFYALLSFPLPGVLYRILLLLASLVISSLGIRIMVGANILLAPSDGVAQAIGKPFGWPMSKSKLAFDIIITAFTAILTLIAVRDVFYVVKAGTVIFAIGTGPTVGFFTKIFPLFDKE